MQLSVDNFEGFYKQYYDPYCILLEVYDQFVPYLILFHYLEHFVVEKQVPNKFYLRTVIFIPYNSRAREISYEFK